MITLTIQLWWKLIQRTQTMNTKWSQLRKRETRNNWKDSTEMLKHFSVWSGLAQFRKFKIFSSLYCSVLIPPVFQIPTLRKNPFIKRNTNLKHGDMQLNALQACLTGGDAGLQPAHQVVLLPGSVVGARQHGRPVHDQLRELPDLDVVLHCFFTQIINWNFAFSTKILCLHLSNNVYP